MSLLLDALKRAEQEKLARTDRPGLQVVAQEQAPAAAAPSVAARGPGKLELEPLAGEAHAAGKGAGPTPAQATHAAKAVFQAKQPPKERREGRRGVLYVVLGIVLLVVAAAGGYVWYVMKSLTPSARPIATRSLPPPPAQPLPPAPSFTTPPAAEAAAASAAAGRGATAEPAVAASVTPAASTKPDVAQAPPVAAPPTREELARELLRDADANRPPPLRLEPSQEAPRVPSEIAAGYAALAGGDLGTARRAYETALARNAASLDALLGMATVEARAGNAAAALARYRQALAVDPGNATALAGVAALANASRPGAMEERLRADLMRQPERAPLHFALGNLLASQRRWGEAQAEYFEAHRLDPSNPDVAHNLAVSLDHLGQRRLAADFYRRAVESAGGRAAQFDARAVERRLAELGG